jgi:hypothetical protein
MGMTLRVFGAMVEEMGKILKMESGEEEEKSQGRSLTGEAGFVQAKRMFKRGKLKCRS